MYVLDANIFIEPYNKFYPFDIAPTFWSGLIQLHAEGKIHSVDPIYKEIQEGKDSLSDWAKDSFKQCFMDISDTSTQSAFAEIMNWTTNSNHFLAQAKQDFASVGDPWVVAYAKAMNFEVVTLETSDPKSKKRIKIPDVCRHFNVPCCNLLTFMRKTGFKL